MNRRIRQPLGWLWAAADVYSVPLAAAVVGWLVGAALVLQVLDWIGFESSTRLALADSPLFVYGAQTLAAVLLFLVADRYLN